MMTEESHGPWYYQQIGLGFNYRMTDVEAALGISQLKKLPSFLEKRYALAAHYDALLSTQKKIIPLQIHADAVSSYHLYVVKIAELNRSTHAHLVTLLRAQGIYAHVHYIPIHLQPFYKDLGFKEGDFPNAECYYQQALTLPLFPDLSIGDVDNIILKLKMCISQLDL